MPGIEKNAKLVYKKVQITLAQINYIETISQQTGMTQAEIIRRAIDSYIDIEERKEMTKLLTPDQDRELNKAADIKNMSKRELVRNAVDKFLVGVLQKY